MIQTCRFVTPAGKQSSACCFFKRDLKLLWIHVYLQSFKPPLRFVGHGVWDRNRSKGSESSHTVGKAHLSSLLFLLGCCGCYCRFKDTYSQLFCHCPTTNQIKCFKVHFNKEDVLLKARATSKKQSSFGVCTMIHDLTRPHVFPLVM